MMAFKTQTNLNPNIFAAAATSVSNTPTMLGGSACNNPKQLSDEKFVENLQRLVKEYLEMHCYDTALFWADKINTLVKDSIKDLYVFIHCLYCCGQFQRGLSIIKEKDLHKKNLVFRYMAAKCHVAAKEYEQALEILNWDEQNLSDNKNLINSFESSINFALNGRNIQAAIHLLRGQIHEALGCSDAAIEYYKLALQGDIYCYEALNALTSNHMLTPKDENTLIQSLSAENGQQKEVEIVKYIYSTKLNRVRRRFGFYSIVV